MALIVIFTVQVLVYQHPDLVKWQSTFVIIPSVEVAIAAVYHSGLDGNVLGLGGVALSVGHCCAEPSGAWSECGPS